MKNTPFPRRLITIVAIIPVTKAGSYREMQDCYTSGKVAIDNGKAMIEKGYGKFIKRGKSSLVV